jgi:hypothetical protein
MKKILIIIIAVMTVALILALPYLTNAYYNYKSLQGGGTRYPSTYFFEPSNLFIACYTSDECIKIKGSACPPSRGGVETCINKEHMQEYLAKIEISSGKEWEVECPNTDNSTNRGCSCVNNSCEMVSS